MQKIFTKPFFWIPFVVLSLLGIAFTVKYFSTAFAIINVKLDMNRSQALEKAATVATQLHLGPDGYRQSASFETDEETQNFVELEGGGKKAFADMIHDRFYSPYTWKVRHFKEFEKNETVLFFKPDGTPYGFEEKLSENAKGAALESEQARLVAEKSAQEDWHIVLSEYTLIETSKEVQPSERIDHTFTYERPDVHVGKGHYRLKLVISGDKLTEFTHSVKIPEAFTLRYKEMRSANDNIAKGANMVVMVLYQLGACLIGLFLLSRRRLIIWKTPVVLAITISALDALVTINQLPLAWMHYNTALSLNGFVLKFIISLLFQFLYMSVLVSFVFMAAESLTRVALGNQPRLWESWSTQSASSFAILGRTMAAYLMPSIYLAYGVAFYLVTIQWFGWWWPSGEIADPNILATYLPWLSPIVKSLGAGSIEECLFRAVPLASAILIGRRFGNKWIWLIATLIIQAIIFGAAHANYPAQPAYARIAELFFPYVVNGLIYLRFGLLPVIVAHFTYDTVLFALPLFVSTAAGAWMNQGMIIVLAAIPLLVVMRARLKMGRWHMLPESLLNSSWQPEKSDEQTEYEPVIADKIITFTQKTKGIMLIAGVVGAALWLYGTQFKQDGQPLPLTRSAAMQTAHDALQNRSVAVPPSWMLLPSVAGNYTDNTDTELMHEFIWQHGDKKTYQSLLGTYLPPARWTMRLVTWTGDETQKSEAYEMSITKSDALYRLRHQLPESATGLELTESEARLIAYDEIEKTFHVHAQELKEVSAVAVKHPMRKDWTFIFADTAPIALDQGQARIGVEVAGNQIVDSERYIHVPEDWQRDHYNKKSIFKYIGILCTMFLYLLLCLGLAAALKKTNIQSLLSKKTAMYAGALALMYLVKIVNMWPYLIANFYTSEPFFHQAFLAVGMLSIVALCKAGGFGLIIARINSWKKSYVSLPYGTSLLYGICAGTCATGVYALLHKLAPSWGPVWANYAQLPAYIPCIGIIIESLSLYINITMLILLLYIIMDHICKTWSDNKKISIPVCITFGILTTNVAEIESILFWLLSGVVVGLMLWAIYHVIAHYDRCVIPIAVGIFIIGQLIQQALFNAYPTAFLGNILACVCILAVSYLWSKKLQ